MLGNGRKKGGAAVYSQLLIKLNAEHLANFEHTAENISAAQRFAYSDLLEEATHFIDRILGENGKHFSRSDAFIAAATKELASPQPLATFLADQQRRFFSDGKMTKSDMADYDEEHRPLELLADIILQRKMLVENAPQLNKLMSEVYDKDPASFAKLSSKEKVDTLLYTAYPEAYPHVLLVDKKLETKAKSLQKMGVHDEMPRLLDLAAKPQTEPSIALSH